MLGAKTDNYFSHVLHKIGQILKMMKVLTNLFLISDIFLWNLLGATMKTGTKNFE